jgi:hypothetical protein
MGPHYAAECSRQGLSLLLHEYTHMGLRVSDAFEFNAETRSQLGINDGSRCCRR